MKIGASNQHTLSRKAFATSSTISKDKGNFTSSCADEESFTSLSEIDTSLWDNVDSIS